MENTLNFYSGKLKNFKIYNQLINYVNIMYNFGLPLIDDNLPLYKGLCDPDLPHSSLKNINISTPFQAFYQE
jgi:hypothetical protein